MNVMSCLRDYLFGKEKLGFDQDKYEVRNEVIPAEVRCHGFPGFNCRSDEQPEKEMTIILYRELPKVESRA